MSFGRFLHVVQANQNFFQVSFLKRIRRGKISSLPANISKISTHLEKWENNPKFCVGPTISRPGPILLKVAATAVKFVVRSKLSMLISKTDKYRADYYEYYTRGGYWTNPVNYDLTLNSARVGREKCVDVIEDYLKIRFDL